MSELIACIIEGGNEQFIMNKLLDEEKLIFTRDELLDKEVLRCRSARDFEDRYLGKGFSSKITVYRILDSRRENFKLRPVYKSKVEVVNVITAPEIEMLVILAEKKYADYCKDKSKVKPSDYCINTLKIKNVKKEEFIKEYFKDTAKLINALKEYKRVSKIQKGESCLADLLKEEDYL